MANIIKAKVVVNDVELLKDKDGKVTSESIQMQPVTAGSEENNSFASATPSGSIHLAIDNPDAFGFFRQGLEYLVDFTLSK